MEQQVRDLAAALNGAEPTRGDIIELLTLIKDEEDQAQWIALYTELTSKSPEKIIGDIDSYPPIV